MGKPPAVTDALKVIKEILFTDKKRPRGSLPICPYHKEMYNMRTSRVPVDLSVCCGKIEKGPENPDEMDELCHLTY